MKITNLWTLYFACPIPCHGQK